MWCNLSMNRTYSLWNRNHFKSDFQSWTQLKCFVNRTLPMHWWIFFIFQPNALNYYDLAVELKSEKNIDRKVFFHITCYISCEQNNVIRITLSQQPTQTMDIVRVCSDICYRNRSTRCNTRNREDFPRENICVTSHSNRITLTALRLVCTRKTRPKRYHSASSDGCESFQQQWMKMENCLDENLWKIFWHKNMRLFMCDMIQPVIKRIHFIHRPCVFCIHLSILYEYPNES